MKKLLLIFCAAFLFSCNHDDDNAVPGVCTDFVTNAGMSCTPDCTYTVTHSGQVNQVNESTYNYYEYKLQHSDADICWEGEKP